MEIVFIILLLLIGYCVGRCHAAWKEFYALVKAINESEEFQYRSNS